jgi:hypothetical protein
MTSYLYKILPYVVAACLSLFVKPKSDVTGNSGSNPERVYGDKFFVCQRINLATQ